MAGGGADIKFLRDAVGKPLTIKGSQFTFRFIKPIKPKLMNMHGAGYERLAVGLGGAQEGYEKVIHEHAQLVSIPSLGRPKQKISPWT